MTAELRIGTSGYSFPHWVGTAYPEGTRQADMLQTYARDFDTVEINFTYYRDPTPEMFEGMLRKVRSDFEFVVKASKGMTHERDTMASVAQAFITSLQPLMDASQLGCVLLQFPQSFHLNDEALDHLKRVADVFVSRDIKASIEFRYQEWYSDRVFQLLEKLQLGFVNVDLPRIGVLSDPTNILTNDVAYYRLHGRNKAAWYNPATGSHCYDYLYSDAELEEWAGRIEGSLDSAKKTYVFGNNCHKGSSFVNALRLKQRFEQEVRSDADVAHTLFASDDPEDRIDEMLQRITTARASESHS
ncbi:DUF72 domain-containing protein [Candidatus Bipolaricaulota bacterium]|nr:DUF72 domain-containing protein [Candidatus Bipolaricaulota bacterium]